MQKTDAVKAPEKRGGDYVAIFVRQLGGIIVAPEPAVSGTTVTIRFPLGVGPPTSKASRLADPRRATDRVAASEN
jgi:hypothetical protein